MPERVKCEKCGMEYAAGAPHHAFCRGNVPDDAECVVCGVKDRDALKECPGCGEVICDCCEDDGEHICD